MLAMTSPKVDSVQGDWRLDEGVLRVSAGAKNRIEIPFVPIEGYQLQVVFTRSGGSGEVNVLLPITGNVTRLWLGGPAATPSGGITLASDHTPLPVKTLPPLIDGQPHELLITVLITTNGVGITATIDGQPFINWTGKADELALDKVWALSIDTRIGLGAEATTSFEHARVRLLEGPPRPIVELTEHSDVVTCLAFAPNGQRFASAGFDGLIHIWNVSDEALESTLRGHTGSVATVAFSASGQFLASGGADGSVRLWDVVKGTEIEVVGSHNKAVMSVAFHPTENLLASAGRDGLIKLWQRKSKEAAQVLHEHNDWISAIAFAPDGQQLASAGWDGSVRLWEMPSGKHRQAFSQQFEKFEAVAFAPQGNLLAAGTQSGTLRIWQLPLSLPQPTPADFSRGITALVFTGDSQTLVVGNIDGTIKLWDLPHSQQRLSVNAHLAGISALAISSKGLLVTGSEDKTIKLWDGAALLARAGEEAANAAAP